jgi:hypothetical protein
MDSGTSNYLGGVWGSSGSDVFAVGDGGTIRHYNGTIWDTSPSGTTGILNGVWGSSSTDVNGFANDVFAVGDTGTILRYNGSAWSSMTSGTTNILIGVWGTANNNVFAVGLGNTILRYNGSSWSSMTNWTYWPPLYGIWGSSGSDVYAVGEYGIISHYPSYSISGSVKTSELSPVSGVQIWYYLYSDWTYVTTDGSGNYTIPNLGNGTFTLYPGKTGYNFDPYNLPVTISGANKTGQDFTAYPPGNPELGWGSMDSGTTNNLIGVCGKSATNVFAVGESGTVLHYNGTSWHSETG